MHIWLRDEARDTERRAPLTPEGAAELIADGATISVERSTKRAFSNDAYEAAGCEMVGAGLWPDAPDDALILGVKELPAMPVLLAHQFCHFAHLFKEQQGWRSELARFHQGRGALYDIEYLTDDTGRRVAAFGYWAGWLGAAIGLWGWLSNGKAGPFHGVQAAETQQEFLDPIKGLLREIPPKVLIVGALGRSGQGARDLCAAAGIEPTCWDMAETANLDRAALLDHDILVSCVLMQGPGLLMVRPEDLDGARLTMIADVACDPLSDYNPLPVYDAPTPWTAPFVEVASGKWVTAIDNLPSLLPKESSEDFAEQLLPTLRTYPGGIAWRNANASFEATCRAAGLASSAMSSQP